MLINLGVPINLLDAVAAGTITGATFATPARASQFTYQTIFGSAPSAINITIQTSLDGTNWVTIDTTTVTTGATVTFQSAAPFIRAKINSITGGTTITVSIIAKTGVIGTESFVSGPSSVTSGSLALFDGTSGDLLKELAFPGDDTLFLSGDGSFKSASDGTVNTSSPLTGDSLHTPITLPDDAEIILAQLTLNNTFFGPDDIGEVQITSVVPHGVTGSTSYGYRVSAILPDGVRVTSPGNHYDSSSCNAVLSASNFNRITWDALPGAQSYLLFRYDGDSGYPIGVIAATVALTADDIGQSVALPQPLLGSATYPLINDGLYISGPGNLASIILDAAGTLGQIRNSGYGGLEFVVPNKESIFGATPLAIYPYNYWGTNGLPLVQIGYGANLNIGNEVAPNIDLSGGIMWGEGVPASQNEANQVQIWQVDDGADNASLWILGEMGDPIVIGNGGIKLASVSSSGALNIAPTTTLSINGTPGVTGDASLADVLHFVKGIYTGKN